jgi:YfiH family protein
MHIYKDHNITIVYGNRLHGTRIIPHQPLPPHIYVDANHLLTHHNIPVKDVVHLDEVHGTHGYVLLSADDIVHVKSKEGDFLITTIPNIALGVLTADCASVIIKSNRGQGVALIHAGWRGATQGIVPRVFTQFLEITREVPSNCTIFFGPSARSCCYQVDAPFLAKLEEQPYNSTSATIFRNGSWYFDVPTYISAQLLACGVSDAQIQRVHNECTICNENWCSYRRNPTSHERQFTFAILSRAESSTNLPVE